MAGSASKRLRGRSRARAIAIAILCAGTLLRVWSAFAVPPRALQGDERVYWKRAERIHRTGDPGTALQAPGQSYVVALGRALTPDSPAGSRGLNLLAYLLAAGAVVSMASGWSRSVVPLAVVSLHPVLIGYCAFLWSETIFLTFLLWAVHLQQSRRIPLVAASGILWGGAALMRHIAAPYFLVALLFDWRSIVHRTGRRSAPLLLAAAFGLAIGPWVVRNQIVLGAPVLSASTGFNLWVGNNDSFGEPYALKRNIRLLLREWRGFGDNELERDAEARRRALDFIASQQPQWLVRKPWAGLKGLLRPDDFVLRTARRDYYGALGDRAHGLLLVVTLGGGLAALGWTVWAIAGCRDPARRRMVLAIFLTGLAVHLLTVSHSRHRLVLGVMGLLTVGAPSGPPTPRRWLAVAATVALVLLAGALSSGRPSIDLLLQD